MRGRVIEPQHDARLSKGRATAERIQSAYLKLVQGGNFRPTLDELELASGLPRSTLRNAYPRLTLLGAAVAEKAPALVIDALGLPTRLSKGESRALAHALLAGERFDGAARGQS